MRQGDDGEIGARMGEVGDAEPLFGKVLSAEEAEAIFARLAS